MENVFLVFYFALFLLAVTGVGKWLTAIFKLNVHNRVEGSVFALAFGTIFFSYVFHALGAVHGLYSNILIAIYVIVAGVHGYDLWRNYQRTKPTLSWKKLYKKVRELKLTEWTVLGPICVLLFILFPLIPYLFLYPASWDVLAYHLPLLKFYLAQHSLPFVAWFAQTGFPIGIEAVYGFGEALLEPRLSHLVHFTYIVATVMYLLYGVKYLFSRSTRWLAAFLFLFQPMLFSEAALSAFIDYPLAFFSLLASMLLLAVYRDKQPLTLVALSLVIGFLPLVKFSGMVIGLAIGLLLGWQAIQAYIQGQKNSILNRLNPRYWLILIITLVPPGLWFIRNWLATKNPFYPFFNSFFKGLAYEPGGKEVLKDDILHNAFVTQMIHNFRSASDTSQDYINLAAIGLVVLGAAASLWFLRSRRVELSLLAQSSLLMLIFLWIIIGPITRYIFFVFPVLSLLISALLFEWRSKRTKENLIKVALQRVFSVLVLIVVFIQIDGTFVMRQKIYTNVFKRQWLYFMDPTTAEAMLYQQDNYRIQMYANTHLDPKQHKVLHLLDNRIYYLDVPVEFANTIAGGYFTNKADSSVVDVYRRIRADGFTHAIKLNAWGAHPSMRGELFDAFMDQYVEPVATESGVTLYLIK